MARSTSIGLDIGTRAVHVAEITHRRGDRALTNFGGLALPQGAINEGEIVEVEPVADAIRRLWSDARIREKRVQIGVANQRVVVRQVDLPYMEESELREALSFQVQEHIPIPVDEAELDFQTLEEFTGEGEARMIRILLVAADREMIAGYVRAVREAGLRPVGVDLNAFAILRAAVPDPEMIEGTEMVVDVGAGVTNIVVHEQGVPRFVRILVLGGDDINEGMVDTLDLDFEEAERVKIAHPTDRGDPAVEVIDRRTGQFVDEIRGSLDYYLAQTGSAQVRRVLLSGGGAKLAGLPERLTGVLRVPVELAHPLATVPAKGTSYGPDQLREIEPVLVTAIGLALGDEQ